MPYTSDDLINAVRMRCQLPAASNDGKFTNADLLELANEEFLTNILPEIRKARGNYYVASVDYTVASGVCVLRAQLKAFAPIFQQLQHRVALGEQFPSCREAGVTIFPRWHHALLRHALLDPNEEMAVFWCESRSSW